MLEGAIQRLIQRDKVALISLNRRNNPTLLSIRYIKEPLMANSTLTSSVITKRAILELKNAMVLLDKVDRQYDSNFTKKVGDTVGVRKRVMYSAVSGADITGAINDTIEGKVNLTLDQFKSVPMQFDSTELTLDIDDFSERYIRPAMVELAQQVESEIANQYKKVWNWSGTPGTAPSTFLELGAAGVQMDDMAVPMMDRCGFFTPNASLQLANGLKGVFPAQIAIKAIEKALIAEYAGFMLYKSQSLKVHTVGAHGGTPLVNGAAQNVTALASKDGYTQSLITDGWTNSITGILLEGDVFTIAGVNSVNPRTKQDTGALQNFVVRADATSGATTGPATLTIAPAIVTTGPYQSVTAAPADNAAITVKTGTASTGYAQNLLFHKDAIAVAFAKLEKPRGNVEYGQESMDGVSVRMVADYNVLTDTNVFRFDILFGVETLVPAAAARITN